jgi:arylsulfatase A-like enzyme
MPASPMRPSRRAGASLRARFPFGLLKGRPFARHQRALVDQTRAFAARPLTGDRPVFRFIHFSIPHLPFAFDAAGYNPPFDPLRTADDEAYAGQLAYVDRLAGDLFDGLKREGTYDRATIVVFADHGYRFGGREEDPLRIPFIVKTTGQRDRRVVSTPAAGEQLLRQVVVQSCAPS